MTRRDRSHPEIFSLSFLDLIFCAMAGVLVLYSIAEPGSPKTEQDDLSVTFIEVQFKSVAKSALISLEVTNGDRFFSATNQFGNSDAHSGSSNWQFNHGSIGQPLIARLVISEKVDDVAKLTIRILDHEVGTNPKTYEFRKVRLGFGSVIPETSGTVSAEDNYVKEMAL